MQGREISKEAEVEKEELGGKKGVHVGIVLDQPMPPTVENSL